SHLACDVVGIPPAPAVVNEIDGDIGGESHLTPEGGRSTGCVGAPPREKRVSKQGFRSRRRRARCDTAATVPAAKKTAESPACVPGSGGTARRPGPRAGRLGRIAASQRRSVTPSTRARQLTP